MGKLKNLFQAVGPGSAASPGLWSTPFMSRSWESVLRTDPPLIWRREEVLDRLGVPVSWVLYPGKASLSDQGCSTRSDPKESFPIKAGNHGAIIVHLDRVSDDLETDIGIGVQFHEGAGEVDGAFA